jgi:hypothetical protein
MDVSLVPILEGCLVQVAKNVSFSKRRQSELGFLRGQMALFMSVYNSIDYSSLIHYHFADLLENVRSVDLDHELNIICKDVESRKWTSDASFPAMNEDILLYVCFLGLPGAPPFLLDNSEVSFAFAWKHIHLTDSIREFQLNPANSSQPTNDGMYLENMLTVAAIAASHSCGLLGAPLRAFVSEFVYHLMDVKVAKNQLMVDFSIWDGMEIDELVVPMLSPPGKMWPAFLDKFNVGNMWRSQNRDMLGFDSNCRISGEAKDHGAKISSPILLNILRRTPPGSDMHLVLVGELQSTYFFKEKFSFGKTFGNKFDCWGIYFLSGNKVEELPIMATDYQFPDKGR